MAILYIWAEQQQRMHTADTPEIAHRQANAQPDLPMQKVDTWCVHGPSPAVGYRSGYPRHLSLTRAYTAS